MNYFFAVLSIAVHACFWGAGLSRLILPGRWRRWWWAFAPGCGWALQSAAIWFAALAGLRGADSYGAVIELVPFFLLAIAGWRGRKGWLASWHGAGAAVLLAAVGAWLLVAPMHSASRGLSAVSLGSCDHADYAAGARVLAEFSRDERAGFLDLPEVTRVGGAEDFFTYWLRLNHFTPAALLAHHGSVFGYEGWQLVSVFTALLAVLNIPLVLLFARAVFGLRGAGAGVVAALYAVSPLCAYGVHHGAMAQFLAMQGVMLATLAARGAAWRWLPLAVVAVWLLAGSYNFILVVAFAPAAGWALWRALVWRDPRGALTGVGVMVVALALCAGIFWGRFAGIIERFRLLEAHDFGWPVPLLGPAGWLGVVRGAGLDAAPAVMGYLGTALVVMLLCLWIWRSGRRVLGPACITLPVIAGYLILAARANTSANASYDAYKFLMVFLPVVLGGCLGWTGLLSRSAGSWRDAARLAVAVLLSFNLAGQADFRTAVARAPLVVTPELRDLRKLEAEPRVASLNLRIEDFWARMWANAFLLRKPQYFVTHSYEARRDTPLRGEWDLSDALLRVLPPGAEDAVVLNPRLAAVRVGAAPVSARFGAGWHEAESDHRQTRWRWSEGAGRVLLRNDGGRPRPVRLALQIRGVTPREARLSLGGKVLARFPVAEGTPAVQTTEFELPAGESELWLDSDRPAQPGGVTDARKLDLAVYLFELRLLPVPSDVR